MIDFISSVFVIVIFTFGVYGILRQTTDEQARWEERKRKREDKNNVD